MLDQASFWIGVLTGFLGAVGGFIALGVAMKAITLSVTITEDGKVRASKRIER